MRREAFLDILGRLNPADVAMTVVNLDGGRAITLESLIRPEAEYAVVRGRESGTTDEGRAFFIPYDEIRYLKLDKAVRPNQLRRLYGETVELDREESFEVANGTPSSADATGTDATGNSQPLDPAAIAKQNLLDRIRAARTSAGGAKPR